MRYASLAVMVALLSATWGCETARGLAGIEADARDHGMITPDDVQWQPGPDVLPEGAEMAILEGDPEEAEYFALRLRLPDGYVIPPHWHPAYERVTVLQGTFHLGMSEQFEPDLAEPMPAGSYFYMPPEMAHFAQAEGETIVQITTVGPWGLIYVDPEDDPRN